jgi:hypothetical protein
VLAAEFVVQRRSEIMYNPLNRVNPRGQTF